MHTDDHYAQFIPNLTGLIDHIQYIASIDEPSHENMGDTTITGRNDDDIIKLVRTSEMFPSFVVDVAKQFTEEDFKNLRKGRFDKVASDKFLFLTTVFSIAHESPEDVSLYSKIFYLSP